LNWIAAASMAQFQRAEWANLHLAAQLHAARTIGKASCQKKRPEAAVRIERNLPSELKTTAKKQQPAHLQRCMPLNADYHVDSSENPGGVFSLVFSPCF
jgi:hypothetical protein